MSSFLSYELSTGQMFKILGSLDSLLSSLSDELCFEFVASIFHHFHTSSCHHVSILECCLCFFIYVDLYLFNQYFHVLGSSEQMTSQAALR